MNKNDKHTKPTRLIKSRSDRENQNKNTAPTVKVNQDFDIPGRLGKSDAIEGGNPSTGADKSVDSMDETKTVLVRSQNSPLSESSNKQAVLQSDAADKSEAILNQSSMMDEASDPVTGWLVIVDGPGKGRSVPVGHGNQQIGRDASQPIPLNFGDTRISRKFHAGLVYDPRSRTFYIQPGDGRNLVYLEDAPVLAPTAITTGALIELGATKLRFVAFCDENFDWNASS